MRSVLINVLRWLLRKLSKPVGNLANRAKALTQEQDDLGHPALSGEAKRHNVYAKLIKEFPEVSKRTIAHTIEEVLS